MQISQDQCKKEAPCGTPSPLLTEVGTEKKQKCKRTLTITFYQPEIQIV